MEISVIIPVYNAERFVAEAVRSALAQPEVREVLLVEDGSPDGSLAVCEELARADERVRLLRHPGGVNRGASASRNLGIRSARMPYVAFLDADDIYCPGRFQVDRAVFAAHADADGVYGAVGVRYDDPEEEARFKAQFLHELTTIRYDLAPEQLFPALVGTAGLLNVGHISLDAITFRKDGLMRLDRLIREDLVMSEDTEFIMRCAYHLRLYPASTREPVTLRRVHPGNRVTRDAHRLRSLERFRTAMWEWVSAQVPDRAVQRQVFLELVHARALTATTLREKAWVLKAVLRNPRILRRQHSAQALVAMVFGRGRIGRGVRKVVDAIFAWLWARRGQRSPMREQI